MPINESARRKGNAARAAQAIEDMDADGNQRVSQNQWVRQARPLQVRGLM